MGCAYPFFFAEGLGTGSARRSGQEALEEEGLGPLAVGRDGRRAGPVEGREADGRVEAFVGQWGRGGGSECGGGCGEALVGPRVLGDAARWHLDTGGDGVERRATRRAEFQVVPARVAEVLG